MDMKHKNYCITACVITFYTAVNFTQSLAINLSTKNSAVQLARSGIQNPVLLQSLKGAAKVLQGRALPLKAQSPIPPWRVSGATAASGSGASPSAGRSPAAASSLTQGLAVRPRISYGAGVARFLAQKSTSVTATERFSGDKKPIAVNKSSNSKQRQQLIADNDRKQSANKKFNARFGPTTAIEQCGGDKKLTATDKWCSNGKKPIAEDGNRKARFGPTTAIEQCSGGKKHIANGKQQQLIDANKQKSIAYKSIVDDRKWREKYSQATATERFSGGKKPIVTDKWCSNGKKK
jgi:hypothetical protein